MFAAFNKLKIIYLFQSGLPFLKYSKIKQSLWDFCLHVWVCVTTQLSIANAGVCEQGFFAIVFKIRIKNIVLECPFGVWISDGREW